VVGAAWSEVFLVTFHVTCSRG